MAKKSLDFQTIRQDIREGRFAPIYLLHGEESYFIDQLTDDLLMHVLQEEEKDFNLSQFYGADVTDLRDVLATCRRYPMMAEHQLVMLREAQVMDQRKSDLNLEMLELYVNQPQESTVFVITYKNKKIDSRLKFVKAIEAAGGVVFESRRYRDYELPKVVPDLLSETGVDFDKDAMQLMCDYIGADLGRMMAEVQKLKVNLPAGKSKVDKAMVAANIGISKEFNNFELVSAVAQRDFRKMELIRRYFVQNPRNNPIQATLAVLFALFTNIMLAHYSANKTIDGLMSGLGLSYPQAKEIVPALRIYNAWKAMQNISLIREYDARLKGARGETLPDDDALKELLFKLTH